MSNNPRVDFLAGINIFDDLSAGELEILASISTDVKLSSGEKLFNEGDQGEELFIVKSGGVAIMVALNSGESLEIARFGEREFFGEMSIFQNQPRSAGCFALEDSLLYSIKGPAFFELIPKHPRTAAKIIRRMLSVTTSRLQNTSKFVNDMVQWGEEARRRAVIDDFTGLYNRRFWDSAIESEFNDAIKNGKIISVVMADLDHFGTLNKEYGEKTCDTIILETSKIFTAEFGPNDILTRYGGDEFAFILPGRASGEAHAISSLVCQKIADLEILHGGGKIKQVTASMGIASFPEHADSLKTLIDNADAALYQAKEAGRNRATVFEKG